jgi:hypothetical protein
MKKEIKRGVVSEDPILSFVVSLVTERYWTIVYEI